MKRINKFYNKLVDELSDFENIKGVDEVDKEVNDVMLGYLFNKLGFEERVEVLEKCILKCSKLPNLKISSMYASNKKEK